MSKCKACENIYRKPGVLISRCGARLNPVEIEKSETEIIEEDNSNE